MTSATSLRMAGLWFLQLDWILQSLSILVGCVNIQCALDRKTHFCIKCNLTVSRFRTHTVWILPQSVSLVKQRAKEEPHLLLQGGGTHFKPWLFCSEAFSNPCALLLPLKCQRHVVDSSSQAFKLFFFPQIWTQVEWCHCPSVEQTSTHWVTKSIILYGSLTASQMVELGTLQFHLTKFALFLFFFLLGTPGCRIQESNCGTLVWHSFT